MHSMNKYTMPRKSTVSSRLFFITMDTSNMIIAKKVMIWGMWCVFLSFFIKLFMNLKFEKKNHSIVYKYSNMRHSIDIAGMLIMDNGRIAEKSKFEKFVS